MTKPASPVKIDWKVGFEIELMAPMGVSRRDLAEQTAERIGGTARRIFHRESEEAAVPGTPVFENLTLGYRVDDKDGAWAASFVDDLTLQADFHKEAKPKPGWYRIVSDDARFLHLAERHCDPEQPLETVLEPLAALFGTEPEALPEGMVRASDKTGASIAIGARLPGERERPCEIVTAPIAVDHAAELGALLDDARALGFTTATESATHIHFNAVPLRSAHFIARFVGLATRFGPELRQLVGANPACVRMGAWPPELAQVAAKPDFDNYSWDEVRATLIGLDLKKYCDFNLVNMVNQDEAKDTLEVRILPGLMETDAILLCAALFEGILRWCNEANSPLPEHFENLLKSLPLDEAVQKHWLDRV